MNFKPISSFKWKHPELAGMDIVDRKLSENAYDDFCNAIETGSETDAHNILAQNPIIFEPILERVGHHAMWFKNKPEIRPTLTNGKKGQIPDCLLAGKGSGGIEWFVVELKSPQDRLFNKNGTFSSVANAGLNQLAKYLKHAVEKQRAIRDSLEIYNFSTPRGIFVIGTSSETEENEQLQQLKSFWNNSLNNITILSYTKLKQVAYEYLQRSKLNEKL